MEKLENIEYNDNISFTNHPEPIIDEGSDKTESEKKPIKYKEIKKYLMGIISKNYDKVGYKLPSEAQLKTKFHVSRITVIAALTELEKDNLIYRKQGMGSFIMHQATPKKEFSKLIGLLVPDFKSKFLTQIFEGIDDCLKQQDYLLLIACTNYLQNTEREMINKFIKLGADGLIIYPSDNQIYNPEILSLSIQNFPIVFVDRTLKGINVSSVKSDHCADTYKAIDYLIKNGHKKIGIVSTNPYGTSTISERIEGYILAHKNNILPVDHRRMLTDLTNYDTDWEKKITNYLKNNNDLTAILAINSDLSYKTLTCIKALKKRVPEDISLIMYDGEYNEILEHLKIVPTCIEQKSYEIGFRAALLLIESIKSGNFKARDELVYSRFNIGNTTRKI